MLVLALATPAGLLLYGLVGPKLYVIRDLSASLPALTILVALAVAALMGRPARVTTPVVAGMAAVLAFIGLRSVGEDYQRPDYKDAAHYLDAAAGASPVVEERTILSPDERLRGSALSLYLERPHPLLTLGADDDAAWRAGRGVWLVRTTDSPQPLARVGGPSGLTLGRNGRTIPGFDSISVQRLQGRVSGRLLPGGRALSWTLGENVTISPTAVRGGVDAISPSGGPLLIGGWALDASSGRPADWVLVFAGGRLLGVTENGSRRFGLAVEGAPDDHSAVRAFAVAGKRATELPLTAAARRMLAGS
jgi:hypothetical protein